MKQKWAEKTEVCTVLFHIYAKPDSIIIIVIIVDDDKDELVMFSPFSLNNFKMYIFMYISLFTYIILRFEYLLNIQRNIWFDTSKKWWILQCK